MGIISKLLKVKEYYGEEGVNIATASTNVRKAFLQMMDEGRCRVFAIRLLNKTLGRIVLFTDLGDKDLADGKNVCHFANLLVHGRLRGHKIGSKLVHIVEREAKKNGFEFLTLGVHPEDQRNISIYNHLGFDIFVKKNNRNIALKNKNGEYALAKETIILKKKL